MRWLPTALLRITVYSGLILLVLFGGLLAGIYITAGAAIAAEEESRFYRLLEEYDFKYRRLAEAGPQTTPQELDGLDRDLNRLEKRTEGVESWLSILKRRRQLSSLDPRFAQSYRQSSRRAASSFPHSEPIAAINAASLIHEAGITKEKETELRKILSLLTDPRYNTMRLSLHVLLGDFKDPRTAAAKLPPTWSPAADLPYDFAGTPAGPPPEEIVADLVIIKITSGEIPSVAADLQDAISAFPSPAMIRLSAEYHYDFGDLRQSARLFSMLPDESALSRQADALWLAGYTENARYIWAMLSPADGPALPEADGAAVASAKQNKALYNLALTASTRNETAELFERLIRQNAADACRQFGLIRYSRLFEAPRAITVLDSQRDNGDPAESAFNTLIDLEIIKRRSENAELARTIAETWILLEHYPEEEDLYQWGAWFFDLQRCYTESGILLKTAARHNFTGRWTDFHDALRQIREGSLDAAEETLTAISADSENWAAAANLGRILEARLAPARAIENYEKAAAAVIGEGRPETASRIQVRIAHCQKIMGRLDESRRTLEYALKLNADNINARLELSRL